MSCCPQHPEQKLHPIDENKFDLVCEEITETTEYCKNRCCSKVVVKKRIFTPKYAPISYSEQKS